MKDKPLFTISRKRFLLWSTAAIAGLGLTKLWSPFAKKKPETGKFLTQDGTLVEVDMKKLESRGIKIYTSELKNWVKQ